MDPTLVQVLVGVITNAFTGVVEKSWASASSIDLEEVVREAVQEVGPQLEDKSPRTEEAVALLRSPEATTLVRLLFVSQVHGAGATTEELRATLVDVYSGRFPRYPGPRWKASSLSLPLPPSASFKMRQKVGIPKPRRQWRTSAFAG
jgi:hypothetical protein